MNGWGIAIAGGLILGFILYSAIVRGVGMHGGFLW
jgi:hypothetical protein